MKSVLVITSAFIISSSGLAFSQDQEQNMTPLSRMVELCLSDSACKDLVAIVENEKGGRRLTIDLTAKNRFSDPVEAEARVTDNCEIDWGLGGVCCDANLVEDPINESCVLW